MIFFVFLVNKLHEKTQTNYDLTQLTSNACVSQHVNKLIVTKSSTNAVEFAGRKLRLCLEIEIFIRNEWAWAQVLQSDWGRWGVLRLTLTTLQGYHWTRLLFTIDTEFLPTAFTHFFSSEPSAVFHFRVQSLAMKMTHLFTFPLPVIMAIPWLSITVKAPLCYIYFHPLVTLYPFHFPSLRPGHLKTCVSAIEISFLFLKLHFHSAKLQAWGNLSFNYR